MNSLKRENKTNISYIFALVRHLDADIANCDVYEKFTQYFDKAQTYFAAKNTPGE